MATQQEQKSRKGRTATTEQKGGRSSKEIEPRANRSEEQTAQQRGLLRRERAYPSPFGNSPFAFMRRFSEEMDRLFEDFGFASGSMTPSFERDFPSARFGGFGEALWAPQVETFEREGRLVIRADLPGLTKDDVNVEINDDSIVLSGERRNENEEKREGYYRSERSYGSFYRQIPLPEGVDADDANATFRDGVLEITMKAPQLEAHSRRLEITEGGSEPGRARGQAAGR